MPGLQYNNKGQNGRYSNGFYSVNLNSSASEALISLATETAEPVTHNINTEECRMNDSLDAKSEFSALFTQTEQDPDEVISLRKEDQPAK